MTAIAPAKLESAMKAALAGPEKKKLKLGSHEFNIKPVRVTRSNGSIHVSGQKGHQISHHLTMRADDQVYYSFDKNGDVVSNLKVEIEKGGTLKTLRDVGAIILAAKELYDLTAGKSDAATDAEALLDGSWEGEAKFIIANVAARVH